MNGEFQYLVGYLINFWYDEAIGFIIDVNMVDPKQIMN